MAQTISSFDTAHAGIIHDAQLDYYGKRLATASSDNTIRIWDVSSDSPTFLAQLTGHEGPVWQLSWAHPKFGNMLASCSYDKKVLIWMELRPADWQVIFRCEEHTASVNGVAWAPWEYGLHLASASSDGNVCVMSHLPDDNWRVESFKAHANGVNSVSWGPAPSPLSLGGGAQRCPPPPGTQKIVTGGCDNQVRLWRFEEASNEWIQISQMTDQPHSNWVRDVAWRPNVGLSTNTIASCAEDGRVILWCQEDDGSPWVNSQTLLLDVPVWRVSWSITGTMLAVACGENEVFLFKETLDGRWEKVVDMGRNPGGMEEIAPGGGEVGVQGGSDQLGSMVPAS